MKITPLFGDAAALEGANLEVILEHSDLTETATATAQTVPLLNLAAKNEQIELVRMELLETFEDTADSANNTTLVEIGDGGDTDRLLTSTELNVNGTEVLIKAGTGTKYVYGSADTVDALVGAPASGKTLAALNKGQLRLLFKRFSSVKR